MIEDAQGRFYRKIGDHLPKTVFYRLRKLRLWLGWPFAIILAIYAESSAQGFWIGIPPIVLGEALRLWSHGYLRKIRALATNGPYAYVRNPLYLGNFLIGLGFCAVIWNPLIFTFFVVGFFLVYWVTVKGEEERLAFRFGKPYSDYAAAVPRFLPRVTPYPGRQNARFALHRVGGHGEGITILAIVVLFLGLYLRQEFYQEHRALSVSTLAVSIFAIGLTMTVVYTWTARRIRGRRGKQR